MLKDITKVLYPPSGISLEPVPGNTYAVPRDEEQNKTYCAIESYEVLRNKEGRGMRASKGDAPLNECQ